MTHRLWAALVRSAASVAAPLAVVLGAGGCFLFGDGGRLRDNRFEDDHVAYTIGLPGDGWQRVKIQTANVAWFDDKLGAALLVNSHCEGVQDAPLEGLAGELLIGMTEREVLEQRVVPFSGREALELTAAGKLDGVVRRRALFVLKKDGCVYDVVYDAPPATFDAGLPAFRRVRDGLVVDRRRDHR